MCYDIFCKIVDNYGDIGVCWRLAKQLANETPLKVRLFIDDFAVASKLIPRLNFNQPNQLIENIEILHFNQVDTLPADVIIEAFSCGLPEPYLQQAAVRKCTWINVDYLSAEHWVDDFHAKPSPHPSLSLTRYFFFPGFTPQTGGLIREKNLLSQRDAFQADLSRQAAFWQRIGVNEVNASALKVSLFCYPQANIADLIAALEHHTQPVMLLVANNKLLTEFNTLFSKQRENPTIVQLPFLTQEDFDCLLWACDLNFVRGEDSWIRAIWAAKPFIWQPYIQTENTHFLKLKAFIDLYYQDCKQKEMVWKAHEYWLAEAQSRSALQNYLNSLENIANFTRQKSAELAKQTDLTRNLITFAKSKTTV